MPLGVISRVSFGFWGDFWRKIAKRENQKNLGKTGFYAAAWDASPRRGRGAQNGTPRVRHGIATLHRGVAQVATVHSEKVFGFLFPTPRIRTPIV